MFQRGMNNTAVIPSVAEFQRMDPLQSERYIAGLPADLRDQAKRNFQEAMSGLTRDFLSAARPMLYPLVAPGGSHQTNATYTENSVIHLDVPSVAGAIGHAILIKLTFTFNYTPAGGSPFANLTAAGWDAAFEEITLQYGAGGVQHRAHPFFFRAIEEWTRGYQKASGFRLFTPASGPIYTDSWLDGQLYSSPTIASGANSVTVWMRVPFNPMHDLAPEGLLSFQGGNTAQLIMRSGSIAGPDPLLNCVYTNGDIEDVTGTITAYLEYRDGRTLTTPAYLPGPDLRGVDTFQMRQNANQNILNAGVYTTQRLTAEGRHHYLFTLAIDGKQATSFSARQNITGLALARDEVGSNAIEKWGYETRLPIEMFWYMRMRRTFGVNFPPGFIPWVIAGSMLETDPDDRLGVDVLNMSDGGYSQVYQQVAVDDIDDSLGIQARLVTFYGSVTRPLQIMA